MKAILVLDMPSNCIEDCIVNCSVFNAKGTPIPNDCPLKPLPDFKKVITSGKIKVENYLYANGFADGYNTCLTDVRGETE